MHTIPKTYAMFFVGFQSHDWLGQVVEDERGVRVAHRFRWYDPIPRPNDVWDGMDVKSWYESAVPGMSVQRGIEMARHIRDAVMLAAQFTGLGVVIVDEVIEETGDQKRLTNELSTRSWCHIQKFDTKEAADRFIAGTRPS